MITQMCSNRVSVDNLECYMDDLVECFEDFIKKSLLLIFLGIGVIVGLLCYLLKLVSERPPLNTAAVGHEGHEENTTHSLSKVNEVIESNTNKKEEQELKTNKLKEKKNHNTDKIGNHRFPLDTGRNEALYEEKSETPDKDIKLILNKERYQSLNIEAKQTLYKDLIQSRGKDIKTDLDKNRTPTKMKTSNLPRMLSFDENVLREVGLSSCSKHECSGGCSTHFYIPSRVPVPSIPTSSSKQKLIPCIRKRSLNRSNVPSLQICPRVTKPGSCCSMCCDEDEPKQNENLNRQILYQSHH